MFLRRATKAGCRAAVSTKYMYWYTFLMEMCRINNCIYMEYNNNNTNELN